MRPFRIAAACLAVVFAGSNLLAQDADADDPSVELVLRLMGQPDASVQVGGAPPEMMDLLYLPSGAQIVGTVVRPWGAVVEVDLSMAMDQVMARLEKSYRSAGWLVLDRGRKVRQRGLVPDAAYDVLYLCRGTDFAHIVPRADDEVTSLTISLSEKEDTRWCRPGLFQRTVDHDDLPILLAPPEALVTHRVSTGGEYRSEVSVQIRSDLTTAALIAHYAQQIEAAGWQPEARCANGAVGAGLWSKQRQNDVLNGLLVIHESTEGAEALLRVTSDLAKEGQAPARGDQ